MRERGREEEVKGRWRMRKEKGEREGGKEEERMWQNYLYANFPIAFDSW